MTTVVSTITFIGCKTDIWLNILSCTDSSKYANMVLETTLHFGCGWSVERSSSNLKVGSSIPSLPHLHAEVSLGKMLNPELPLIEP